MTTDIHVDGNISAVGNIITTNSNLQAPQGSIYVQANIVAAGQIYATGNIYSSGTLSVTGAEITGDLAVSSIATDIYNYANGQPIPLAGTGYDNSNVATFLPTYTGVLAGVELVLSNTSVTLGANVGTGDEIVAIGANAAFNGAGDGLVAIGNAAGQINAGANAVYIGNGAGRTHGVTSGVNMVAIGAGAGGSSQGGNAVAIGFLAGAADQANNSIVLNATGVALDAGFSGMFAAPLREDNPNVTNGVYYNFDTKEILIGPNPITNGPNGIYNNADVQLFLASGTLSDDIIPGGNGVYSLGNSTQEWSSVHSETVYLKQTALSADSAGELTSNGNVIAVFDSFGDLTANLFAAGAVRAGQFLYPNGAPLIDNGVFIGNVEAVDITTDTFEANTITVAAANLDVITSTTINNSGLVTTEDLVANESVTSNIIFSNTVFNTGNVSTAGIKTDNYYYANGAPISFAGSYGNSNVANYLPTYTGPLTSVGAINSSGTITGTYFIGNGALLTGLPPTYTNSNVATYLASGTLASNVTTTANVNAAYFIGNGSQLTGLPPTYTDANVAAFLPTYTGNLGNVDNIGAVGNIDTLGNLTVAGDSRLGPVGNVVITGGTTGQVLSTDGTGNLSWTSNPINIVPPVYLVAPFAGNNQVFSNTILASYNSNTDMTVFYNGSLLENTYYTLAGDELTVNIPLLVGDGIDVVRTLSANVNSIVSSGYGNSNVAAYLPLYTGNLGNLAGNVTTTGNIVGANVIGGNIRLTGNTISSTQDTITIDPLNDGTSAGNVIIAGSMLVQGNLTYNDVVNATTTDLLWIAANDAASSSLASGGGLGVGPSGTYATFTFNSGANVWQSSLPLVATGGANLNGPLTGATTGAFSGNVSADYFLGNGSQLTGLYGNTEVSAFLTSGDDTSGFTTSGDIVANNIFADGSLNATGDSYYFANMSVEGTFAGAGEVHALYFTGDGANLTGLPAGYANSDVANYLASNANIVISTTGNIKTTANIETGGYFIGNGSQLTGLPAGYTNQDVANYLPDYTGNLGNVASIDATGNITVIGNVTAAHFYGDGTTLTGMYSNANAANYLPNYSGNLSNVASIVASGNLQVDNITANANISAVNLNVTKVTATGNISGANIAATTIAATGNITAGNITATGNIATANLTATNGNIVNLTTANATISGNLTAGNLIATGTVTATNIGNITPINLSGTVTQWLAGNGTWQTPPGVESFRNITKVDQIYGYGNQFIIADGRLYIIKGNGTNNAFNSGLGNFSNGLNQGINNMYELPFLSESIGTIVDAGSYGYSSYALFANGNLYTWGYNGYGQLGLGNTADQQFPVLSNTGVAQVYTHPSQAQSPNAYIQRLVIRKTNNTFFGCGHDGQGQLGLGTTNNKITWTAMPWIPTTVLSVWNLGGDLGSMFIQLANGNIQATGWNGRGQLGVGNYTAQYTTPVNANGWLAGDSTMRIQSIGWGGPYNGGSGQENYCNITMFLDNGSTSIVRGAGDNNWGSLGTGNLTSTATVVAPITTTGFTGRVAKMLFVGPSPKAVYALMTNGDLYGWGYNGFGEIATGGTAAQQSPYLITTNALDIDGAVQGWDVSGYFTPSPFIKKADGYYSSGYGAFGQLGNGTTDTNNVTLQRLRVPSEITFKFFGCFSGSNEGLTRIGITEQNTIWAWGYNALNTIDATNTATVVQPLEFYPMALDPGSAPPSVETVPAFSATGTGNTVISATFTATQVAYPTEVYDSNNWFASNRYTPQRAGWYQINGGARCLIAGGDGTVEASVGLRKNGAYIGIQGSYGSTIGAVSQLVYFNGTTDYVDVVVNSSQLGNVVQNAAQAFFNGYLVRV